MFPPRILGALAPSHFRGFIAGSLVLGGLSLSATAQSFSSAITFDEALQDYGHGDIVDPDAYGTMLYYSPRITVTPPTSSLTKAVIFDTEDPQTIANTSDPDLIPNTKGNVKTQDLGNVIIIQENNGFTTTGDSINNPYKKVDDDAKGGTITFDFNPDAGVTIDSLRLTFLDLEKQGDISFVFSDGTVSKTIAGTNIEGETAIVYGDGNANETRFYTASELGLTSINQLQVISKTSFAVDNIRLTGSVPEVSSSLLLISSSLLFCFRRRRNS